MVVLFSAFWGSFILFFIMEVPIYIATNSMKVSLFSTRLPTLVSYLLDIIAILIGVSALWLWFWCVFPWWFVMFRTFSCSSRPLSYLWENVYSDNLFFNWIVLFSPLFSHASSSYILDINSLPDKWFSDIFFNSIGCLFTFLMIFLSFFLFFLPYRDF